MTRTWTVLIAASLVLSGCAQVRESRFNPLNWFNRAERLEEVAEGENPLIPVRDRSIFAAEQEEYAGEPIEVISRLRLDPTPGGAILLVYGASAASGAYDVRLVQDDSLTGERTLVFDLRLLLPERVRPGPQTVVAARTLSRQDLAGVREILVRGSQNGRSVRP